MGAAVEVVDLTMSYGDAEVLRGVSFEVGRGEVFALLGSNGAGKTTTIEILEGHRRRTGGSVGVLGRDPERADRAWRDRIGIVLQSTAIDPDLTVGETTRQHARYHTDPLHPTDALELVGLADDRPRRVGILSGGQRRRLDLALALVGRPDLVFLDEPTTGFDPMARHDAWRLVEKLRDEGVTVVLTTHHLDEVERLAHRVGILRDGRLVASGTVDELRGPAVEISFATDDVAAAALGRRFPLTSTDELWRFRSDDPQRDVRVLTELAAEQGWRLEDLRVAPPDLEARFLELVSADA